MSADAEFSFADMLRAEQCKARQAVRDFVEGAVSGDVGRMFAAFSSLDNGEHCGGGWRRAFTMISRVPSVPKETRDFFLQVHVSHGDHIRQETGHDLSYASGLRVLLPRYMGPAMKLYRGEGALNRKHRTYGLSWSSNKAVARSFAETSAYRCSEGGSVLLATLALPEAIICVPAMFGDRYEEREVIVDRRCLSKVHVEERFPQLTIAELETLKKILADRSP